MSEIKEHTSPSRFSGISRIMENQNFYRVDYNSERYLNLDLNENSNVSINSRFTNDHKNLSVPEFNSYVDEEVTQRNESQINYGRSYSVDILSDRISRFDKTKCIYKRRSKTLKNDMMTCPFFVNSCHYPDNNISHSHFCNKMRRSFSEMHRQFVTDMTSDDCLRDSLKKTQYLKRNKYSLSSLHDSEIDPPTSFYDVINPNNVSFGEHKKHVFSKNKYHGIPLTSSYSFKDIFRSTLSLSSLSDSVKSSYLIDYGASPIPTTSPPTSLLKNAKSVKITNNNPPKKISIIPPMIRPLDLSFLKESVSIASEGPINSSDTSSIEPEIIITKPKKKNRIQRYIQGLRIPLTPRSQKLDLSTNNLSINTQHIGKVTSLSPSQQSIINRPLICQLGHGPLTKRVYIIRSPTKLDEPIIADAFVQTRYADMKRFIEKQEIALSTSTISTDNLYKNKKEMEDLKTHHTQFWARYLIWDLKIKRPGLSHYFSDMTKQILNFRFLDIGVPTLQCVSNLCSSLLYWLCLFKDNYAILSYYESDSVFLSVLGCILLMLDSYSVDIEQVQKKELPTADHISVALGNVSMTTLSLTKESNEQGSLSPPFNTTQFKNSPIEQHISDEMLKNKMLSWKPFHEWKPSAQRLLKSFRQCLLQKDSDLGLIQPVAYRLKNIFINNFVAPATSVTVEIYQVYDLCMKDGKPKRHRGSKKSLLRKQSVRLSSDFIPLKSNLSNDGSIAYTTEHKSPETSLSGTQEKKMSTIINKDRIQQQQQLYLLNSSSSDESNEESDETDSRNDKKKKSLAAMTVQATRKLFHFDKKKKKKNSDRGCHLLGHTGIHTIDDDDACMQLRLVANYDNYRVITRTTDGDQATLVLDFTQKNEKNHHYENDVGNTTIISGDVILVVRQIQSKHLKECQDCSTICDYETTSPLRSPRMYVSHLKQALTPRGTKPRDFWENSISSKPNDYDKKNVSNDMFVTFSFNTAFLTDDIEGKADCLKIPRIQLDVPKSVHNQIHPNLEIYLVCEPYTPSDDLIKKTQQAKRKTNDLNHSLLSSMSQNKFDGRSIMNESSDNCLITKTSYLKEKMSQSIIETYPATIVPESISLHYSESSGILPQSSSLSTEVNEDDTRIPSKGVSHSSPNCLEDFQCKKDTHIELLSNKGTHSLMNSPTSTTESLLKKEKSIIPSIHPKKHSHCVKLKSEIKRWLWNSSISLPEPDILDFLRHHTVIPKKDLLVTFLNEGYHLFHSSVALKITDNEYWGALQFLLFFYSVLSCSLSENAPERLSEVPFSFFPDQLFNFHVSKEDKKSCSQTMTTPFSNDRNTINYAVSFGRVSENEVDLTDLKKTDELFLLTDEPFKNQERFNLGEIVSDQSEELRLCSSTSSFLSIDKTDNVSNKCAKPNTLFPISQESDINADIAKTQDNNVSVIPPISYKLPMKYDMKQSDTYSMDSFIDNNKSNFVVNVSSNQSKKFRYPGFPMKCIPDSKHIWKPRSLLQSSFKCTTSNNKTNNRSSWFPGTPPGPPPPLKISHASQKNHMTPVYKFPGKVPGNPPMAKHKVLKPEMKQLRVPVKQHNVSMTTNDNSSAVISPRPQLKAPLGRKIYWKPLRAGSIEGTIFAEISGETEIEGKTMIDGGMDVSGMVNTDFLSRLFVKSAPPKPSISKLPLKMQKKEILDAKRAQNISIVLARIPWSPESLVHSLHELDCSYLTVEALDRLEAIMLTPEEDEKFSLFFSTGGISSQLRSIPEQRLLPLRPSVTYRVIQSIQLLRFQLSYKGTADILQRDLDLLKSATEEVKNSLRFRQVLSVVLRWGNYINHGVADGDLHIRGFTLGSLLKLTEFKTSIDSSITALHYLAANMLNSAHHLHLEAIREDMPSVPLAAKLSGDALQNALESLLQGNQFLYSELNITQKDLIKRVTETQDLSLEHRVTVLTNFYEKANHIIVALEAYYYNVNETVYKTGRFFGDDTAHQTNVFKSTFRSETFFQTLEEFLNKFHMCCQDVLERPKKYEVLLLNLPEPVEELTEQKLQKPKKPESLVKKTYNELPFNDNKKIVKSHYLKNSLSTTSINPSDNTHLPLETVQVQVSSHSNSSNVYPQHVSSSSSALSSPVLLLDIEPESTINQMKIHAGKKRRQPLLGHPNLTYERSLKKNLNLYNLNNQKKKCITTHRSLSLNECGNHNEDPYKFSSDQDLQCDTLFSKTEDNDDEQKKTTSSIVHQVQLEKSLTDVVSPTMILPSFISTSYDDGLHVPSESDQEDTLTIEPINQIVNESLSNNGMSDNRQGLSIEQTKTLTHDCD